MPRGCTGSEIVLALTFVAAGHADALQVAHRGRIFGRKLLRINAERTREASAVRRRRAALWQQQITVPQDLAPYRGR